MDRKEIVDYLAKKVFNGEFTEYRYYYIMLKNKQIYPLDDYGKLVESYKISPEDAFVYIDPFDNSEDKSYNLPVKYLFPLIDTAIIYGIVNSYLSKLGFYKPYNDIYPATGLKYFVVIVRLSDRLVIELTDFDTVATNTGLRKIIVDMLGKDILTQREISSEQKLEIIIKLGEQKLFAGHNRNEAYSIINGYYVDQKTSLAKDVLAIANAYNQIFEPYRVVYDTRTRQLVLM